MTEKISLESTEIKNVKFVRLWNEYFLYVYLGLLNLGKTKASASTLWEGSDSEKIHMLLYYIKQYLYSKSACKNSLILHKKLTISGIFKFQKKRKEFKICLKKFK